MKNFAVVRIFIFGCLYIADLVRANLRLALDILTPANRFSPTLCQVSLPPLSEGQLLLLSNLISMTPGTLTVDCVENNTKLIVHVLYAESIRDLEEIFLPRFYALFPQEAANA